MLRARAVLLLICLSAGLSHGMDCTFGSDNLLEKIMYSCPGFLQSSDKAYCCFDIENDKPYCCTQKEFAFQASWVVTTVIIVVGIVLALIALCISCLCFIFCRRRRCQRGTVYGHVQVPVVQVTHQQPNYPIPVNATGLAQPQPHTNTIYV
ncbi:uncharacterized protein LOC128888098 [Hylaeus anthracinus]|uniref:uncharacterized protein LOC128888098 n=1 Tax=Hylaeus anthracinus TaxID=313031 RepID=UPI0023B9BE1A|nr:uncharacterized protein LOC128888098 [Hylaeus anthracinus]